MIDTIFINKEINKMDRIQALEVTAETIRTNKGNKDSKEVKKNVQKKDLCRIKKTAVNFTGVKIHFKTNQNHSIISFGISYAFHSFYIHMENPIFLVI